ncbi:16868_t:CDS:2 [Dentiscutata erythropus]|uniref:16868_t:CDS:1 n=1 Tax=Dentiscutata erythropus TaxID=1348616 RepID=A0A9N9IVT9_9GLOM|nr:16868_t:CDS:2 [Dentiscutata erythropus]
MSLDVHPSTIGCLIKNKDNVEDNLSAKRQKTVQYLNLENSLLEWILQNQDRIILNTTLATTHLKGRKKNKEQLTITLCANADGMDKIKLLVIRKSPNPCCFKGIKRNRLGVTYESSANAWMTTILFQKWLKEFDLKMAGRKTLLLMDGAKVHSYSNLNL